MRKTLSALATVMLAASPLSAASPGDSQDKASAVVRALLVDDGAVATVGYRLASANVDLCGATMVESGMLIETLAQYGADYRSAAGSILGLSDRPTVAFVVPGSPAERAGVLARDILVSADGTGFAASPPKIAGGTFTAVAAAIDALDAALVDRTMQLTVERGGKPVTLTVVGTSVCRARFQLLPDADPDATASGTWVQISTQLAGYAASPNELAAVLGHELAHNALGHRRANPTVQRLHELQADRLMPYLMARAGYDPQAAVSLWHKLKRKRLGGLLPSATHPGWSERLKVVTAETARIAQLKARGEPILPPVDLIAR